MTANRTGAYSTAMDEDNYDTTITPPPFIYISSSQILQMVSRVQLGLSHQENAVTLNVTSPFGRRSSAILHLNGSLIQHDPLYFAGHCKELELNKRKMPGHALG